MCAGESWVLRLELRLDVAKCFEGVGPVCICMQMYIHENVYVCICIHMHIHVYGYEYVCKYVWARVACSD